MTVKPRLRALPRALIAAAVCSPMLATAAPEPLTIRFATFNASLNRNFDGQMLDDLAGLSTDAQAANRTQQMRNVAEIIQRVNPDVLLVNEFDYTTATRNGKSAPQLFQDNFLSVGQNGYGAPASALPISFAHHVYVPSNTGVPSGFDLDNNGSIGGGNDAYGFGNYPGQFGFVIFSKHPIDQAAVRTFQTFLWKDMPGALLPDNAATPAAGDFYSAEELAVFRLSSKNHVDVPVNIAGNTVHLLASHPTPPVFDGAEDRNGRRNHDEIRFWHDYVSGANYMTDDQGRVGGLSSGARYVLTGDMNADPFDGDATGDPASAYLMDPTRFLASETDSALTPDSLGGPAGAAADGNANNTHVGNPAFDTADFADGSPGNLRVDYVLPDADAVLALQGIGRAEDGTSDPTGVFWPSPTLPGGDPNPLWQLVGRFGSGSSPFNLYSGFRSSDHKAVWVDLQITPVPEPSTIVLFAAGLGFLGASALRRSRR